MKSCIACSAEIEEDNNFCKKCGAYQSAQTNELIKSNASFLTILCILTIVGSLFGMARGWLYEIVAGLGNSSYSRGWVYIITNIGTLIGAVMMLNRKKTGLYLYTISQSIYILTVLFATLVYENMNAGGFAFSFSLLFLVPSIAFLIMYWLETNKKHLK